MLKLGIIGTNWISGQFVEAALGTKAYSLHSVYSRTLDKAEKFGQPFKNNTQYFVDLQAFLADSELDVVYIASPNSLHFQQAQAVIAADKHVIVEKPAFANPMEMVHIQRLLAQHPDVYYFEAARHVHEPNFKTIRETVQRFEHTDGAVLTYMKYSSRFDQYLDGGEPNIFSAKFAGGALQDLGVYLVYDALSWFGIPQAVMYQPVLLNTGVDGQGTAVLSYADFQVTLITGKNVQSNLPSEIYSGKQTLTIDNAGELNQVQLLREPEASPQLLSEKPAENPMTHEAAHFAQIINSRNQQAFLRLNQLSIAVNQTIYNLRRSAGIIFPADQLERFN